MIPSPELHWLPAAQLLRAFGRRELSPVEVIEAVLARTRALQPVLNAFCLVDEEAALASARASELRWRAGQALGPLDGVPVSIKDLLLTRGWPTLRGSHTIDPAQLWTEDAPSVARQREAGAVLFGKTTTPEFAMGPVTLSPLTGISRNPWLPDRTPGGSSGGAAAAVAAGLGPVALGTDAGGSIRLPASFCGVFGFKPTVGRVPNAPPTPFASLASVGPLCRSVADAAATLDRIALPDVRDAGALPPPSLSYAEALSQPVSKASRRGLPSRPLAGLRVAWSPTLGYARVDPDVARLTAAAALDFESLGAHVVEVKHIFEDPEPVLGRLKRAFMAFAFQTADPATLNRMDPVMAAQVIDSRGADLLDFLGAMLARERFITDAQRFFEDHDLLLTPTCTTVAFDANSRHPAGHHRTADWHPFTAPFNLSRQPAASVPCGFINGLPVGLQIVAPLYEDLRVLQAAAAFEAARPWLHHRPPICQANTSGATA